jgi:fatty-acyl-CoA synthase
LTITSEETDPDGAAAVSWSRLHRLARRMTTALAAAGVGRGSRVGLLGEPSAHLVTALQAVWLAGASVTVLPRRPGGRRPTGSGRSSPTPGWTR